MIIFLQPSSNDPQSSDPSQNSTFAENLVSNDIL